MPYFEAVLLRDRLLKKSFLTASDRNPGLSVSI